MTVKCNLSLHAELGNDDITHIVVALKKNAIAQVTVFLFDYGDSDYFRMKHS